MTAVRTGNRLAGGVHVWKDLMGPLLWDDARFMQLIWTMIMSELRACAPFQNMLSCRSLGEVPKLAASTLYTNSNLQRK